MKTGCYFLKRWIAYPTLLVFVCLLVTSCKKDSFITSSNAALGISTDSLKYDTVFTSIGSITKSFKIINPNNQKLLLSKVKLMGGSGSAFKINVNGISNTEVDDIEISANDSIYVFATVNINPNTTNLAFIVKDSIQVMYNGNIRFVQLEAFGQNANFLRNRIITGNITWANNLPYVILGSLQVDTNAILTIASGCKIYSHANAPIIVDGSLLINGTSNEKVVFSGDRLDENYRDLPASWPGIYFRGSSQNNSLNFTTIKNAYQALVAEQLPVNGKPKIVLHQCIIDNAYDAGILCVNSSLQADNTLISNCGKNINILYGGNYLFTNCTIAAYSSFITHKNAVLNINNFATLNGATVSSGLNANFVNCIVWGESGAVDDELNVSKQGSNNFSVTFSQCIYKAKTDPPNTVFTSSLKNLDPLFDGVDGLEHTYNFHINSPQAPGINKGAATSFSKDLDGNNRNNGLPDLGCYEKQ
ncbi:MAG: hypothetical protein ABIN94_11985 [Ferruginibacter sp.]